MATITKNGITLSTDRGSGSATITVTATKNTSRFPREEYFTINAEPNIAITIKVVQAGAITNRGDVTENTGSDTETNL